MKTLKHLLSGLTYTCLHGNSDIDISSVIYDSRKVTPGSLFICIVGANSDGHKFIPDVIAKGAACIVVSRDIPEIEALLSEGDGSLTVQPQTTES